LNRINTFIIIFLSAALTFLVIYLWVSDYLEKELETITAPLKIEAYRIDRYPLPDADIYLNQKFIGKTDDNGFFYKDIILTVGKSYTLIVEKERDGYVYGPWETHFKVEEEGKKRREKRKTVEDGIPSLEGEFDVLTELERAQLGRASLYEKYHFLAIVDGYMYYTIKVYGKGGTDISDATVIVDGKYEGITDTKGIFVVQYSGEDRRRENIQILKEGEHVWMNDVDIQPDLLFPIELNKMLLIDLYTYTEIYDVIEGIRGSKVYLGDSYKGKTRKNGRFSFKYVNEEGVDGYLELTILYPSGFYPDKMVKTYLIQEDLPRLSGITFSYPKKAVAPKISVLPLTVGTKGDYLLLKRAQDLKTRIEDYLSLGGIFTSVSSTKIEELFKGFDLEIGKKDTKWSEIPLIKKEVDGIIFGKLNRAGNTIEIELYGIDYTGELISEIKERVSLRELQSVPENFVDAFKKNFPFEGNITAVSNKIYINLGKRHGIDQTNKFYSFYDYYDDIKKDYAKKRVAKLKIVDAGEMLSACELESIREGYLLEAGVKVKRHREPAEELKEVPVTIVVVSNRKPVENANIYLDDNWRGQTDEKGRLQLTLAESVNADVLVYKDGYVPGRVALNVREDATTFTVHLKQGKTSFSIDSEPQGALLFIDSEYKGITPIIQSPLIIPYGYHLIELELKGYKEFKKYIKFDKRKLSFTGSELIHFYRDYYQDAEDEYANGNINKAIAVLRSIPQNHPDYSKAMEFLGYIYLNDVKDYNLSLAYYNRVLDLKNSTYTEGQSIISFYNMGQAYYNEAEGQFYSNKSLSQENYKKAIVALNAVRDNKSRLPLTKRSRVYQDVLFYLSVSYQKLYYLTGQREYLSSASFSWIDYFDFFNNDFLTENYFKDQHSVAESYRNEVKRLKGEE